MTLTDSHALIDGARGSYTVHLGSGVVHQKGGAMLHILPVHSQKRGKLFLPFVDEDPKIGKPRKQPGDPKHLWAGYLQGHRVHPNMG